MAADVVGSAIVSSVQPLLAHSQRVEIVPWCACVLLRT